MGKRVPEYVCCQMRTEKMQTKFIPREIAYDEYETNKIGYGTGYVVNINHSSILPLWIEYNKFIKETGKPLGDSDRAAFELDVIENIYPEEFMMTNYSQSDRERIKATIKDFTKYEKWVNHRRKVFKMAKAG